jgi:polyhydroxyalkanoate synthesis regulator phasin
MAQSGGGSKSGSKSAARSRSATRSSSSSRGSASTRAAAPRKAAAKKGGQARGRQQKAQKAASSTAKTASRGARRAGVEAKTVAEFREALRKNLIKPMEMVLISRERIEEVLGEAVDQGRVTARDAQRITSGLVKRGQRQTSDVLKDLEQLLERGRGEVGGRTAGARKAAGGAAGRARKAAGGAAGRARKEASGAAGRARKEATGTRSRAVRTASPALAQVDRARRGAGVGPNFPVLGYEELNATQIQSRLKDLTPAQLRKVRDYEKRNSNRKTILKAIETKLG